MLVMAPTVLQGVLSTQCMLTSPADYGSRKQNGGISGIKRRNSRT